MNKQMLTTTMEEPKEPMLTWQTASKSLKAAKLQTLWFYEVCVRLTSKFQSP